MCVYYCVYGRAMRTKAETGVRLQSALRLRLLGRLAEQLRLLQCGVTCQTRVSLTKV